MQIPIYSTLFFTNPATRCLSRVNTFIALTAPSGGAQKNAGRLSDMAKNKMPYEPKNYTEWFERGLYWPNLHRLAPEVKEQEAKQIFLERQQKEIRNLINALRKHNGNQ